ncbi:hypothetical protein BHE74_00043040 [Ensete ventricosum]|nr:hypothetical protein BHE74_00043040 [Ensete ventricosum]
MTKSEHENFGFPNLIKYSRQITKIRIFSSFGLCPQNPNLCLIPPQITVPPAESHFRVSLTTSENPLLGLLGAPSVEENFRVSSDGFAEEPRQFNGTKSRRIKIGRTRSTPETCSNPLGPCPTRPSSGQPHELIRQISIGRWIGAILICMSRSPPRHATRPPFRRSGPRRRPLLSLARPVPRLHRKRRHQPTRRVSCSEILRSKRIEAQHLVSLPWKPDPVISGTLFRGVLLHLGFWIRGGWFLVVVVLWWISARAEKFPFWSVPGVIRWGSFS